MVRAASLFYDYIFINVLLEINYIGISLKGYVKNSRIPIHTALFTFSDVDVVCTKNGLKVLLAVPGFMVENGSYRALIDYYQ